MFGFLFSSEKLHSLDDESLKSCCNVLETKLKMNDQSDISGKELHTELKLLLHLLPKQKMTALEILNYLK